MKLKFYLREFAVGTIILSALASLIMMIISLANSIDQRSQANAQDFQMRRRTMHPLERALDNVATLCRSHSNQVARMNPNVQVVYTTGAVKTFHAALGQLLTEMGKARIVEGSANTVMGGDELRKLTPSIGQQPGMIGSPAEPKEE